MKALQRYRLSVAVLASLAALAGMVLVGGGCAEKITGTGPPQEMSVRLDLKAGPTISFRITVTAADMDTVTFFEPANSPLVLELSIPVGTDRHFLIEALDLTDVVIYRGEAVRDVTTLVPLDLTIPMEPVVPLIYLNPHFAVVELGSAFTITVNANELIGAFRAGIGLSLFDFDQYKLADIAFIDTVVLAPAQIERGSSLTYQLTGSDEVYFTVDNSLNESAIVDEQGDSELVIIHCRTQDTWPGEPVAFEPQMFIEVLDGLELPPDEVSLDTARFLLDRSRVPESYLGGPGDDIGVALVNVGGGETVLVGDVADFENNEGAPQLFIAQLGSDQVPIWENTLSWPNNGRTTGLTQAGGAGYFVCGTPTFGGGAVSRLDETGNEIWREELANLGGGLPYALAQRPGGGCVAAGSWSNDGLHFYLAVFDDSGYEQHFAPTNFSSNQEYRSVVVLDDTTFVAAGYEQDFSGPADAILAKITIGETIKPEWSRNIGGSGEEAAFDLLALNDGGFLVVGTADTLSNGQNDMFVTRTDSEGFLRWTRYFGAPNLDETALSVSATPDGHFIAAGSSAALRTNRDVYVVKFDGAGNLIWENTLGGPGDDLAQDVVPLGSGYLLTGLSNPGPLGQSDILVLRLGSDGKNLAD